MKDDNIFEGAEFRDTFICKNGSIVVYHRNFMNRTHYCICKELCDRIEYNSDGTCRGDSEWDIVSRYQDPPRPKFNIGDYVSDGKVSGYITHCLYPDTAKQNWYKLDTYQTPIPENKLWIAKKPEE